MTLSAVIIHDDETIKDLENTIHSLKGCVLIDVITRDPELVDKLNLYFVKGFSVTVIMPDRTFKAEINDLINNDGADFIIILKAGYTPRELCERIERYYASGRKLSMIKPPYGSLNGLLVNVPTFQWLCGYGEQSIVEKIEIQAANEGREDMILTWEEFYERTN